MSQLVNQTIDNTDPTISFNGLWWDIGAGDPFFDKFYDKTFYRTSVNGDYVDYTWTGGNVWVYGSKRPNHGHYSVIFDGNANTETFYDGYSSTDQARQLLVSTSGYPVGEHTIRIINQNEYDPFWSDDPTLNRTELDIDYLVVEVDPSSGSSMASADSSLDGAPPGPTTDRLPLSRQRSSSSTAPSPPSPSPSISLSSSSNSARRPFASRPAAVGGPRISHEEIVTSSLLLGSATPSLS